MAIIIPPPSYHKEDKNRKLPVDESSTKIIIYFRKEIDALDKDAFIKLGKIIQEAQDLGLFDEIYIVKGRDVLDVMQFKEAYHAAALNEIKYLKQDVNSLKMVVHGLLKIVRMLRRNLEKMYEKL